MPKTDLLFIDLLYRPKGSFDDDFATITKAVDGQRIFHLKVAQTGRFGPILQVIAAIWRMSPPRVVFLSAKIWQLMLLAPLMLFKRGYAVYHFRPNTRGGMHDRVLPWLACMYKLAAYSAGVQDYLSQVTGKPVPLLASRIIEKHRAFARLVEKMDQDHVDIFCPGIRPGVRVPIDYKELRREVETALGKPVRIIVVQDAGADTSRHTDIVHWAPMMLSDEDYTRHFDESLVIPMKFASNYEARSSAMINDALGRGCIVLTEAHPITAQYGLSQGMVTDLANLPTVIKRVASGQFGPDNIPGFDYAEAKRSWTEFLKLGA